MIVTLIGKNGISKTVLPEIINGNYSVVNESNNKTINIEGINNSWKIFSNTSFKIIYPKEMNYVENYVIPQNLKVKFLDSITLKEYNFYYILFSNSNDVWILYCSPTFETYMPLEVTSKNDITIGSDMKNSICFNNRLVKRIHAKLYYNRGQLLIKNYDKQYGCYINNKHVTDFPRLVFNGDVIFVMGLKIIIMGRKIFINNPLNQINYNNQIFAESNPETIDYNFVEENEEDVELYNEKDYFAKAPRIVNIIEKEKIRIDSPPQENNNEGIPAILTIGSTLSMGAIMMASSVSTIRDLINGKVTFGDSIPSLLLIFFMLIGMILLPLLEKKYEKKQKINYKQKRQQRYKKYIDSKANHIEEIKKRQRDILYENFISAEECNRIIQTKNSRLWERNKEDYDFLTVRLGRGDIPLEIDVDYPEEQFTMEDDNLVDLLSTIGNKSKILKDAPITTSLAKKNISAIIVKDNLNIQEKIIKNIIIQLVTLHSYEDLKIVFLLKEDKEKKWEHMKMLPHIWDNTKQIRFFADEYNDMIEISRFLEEEFSHRADVKADVDYKSFSPYYVIITDDYKKIERLKIIKDILNSKDNRGYSILCLTDNLTKLPSECKTFINVDEDYNGVMFESEVSSITKKTFKCDTMDIFFFEKICKEISSIPIKYSASEKINLPSSYSFLEMYQVGRIEQLNITQRWKKNDSTISLQAPIGIDSSGNIINLDIHEKFHGPHGLIAGSTGSGKSEFIITYILSLAINYHPNDLAFILIDYKGGGLAGAFKKKEIKLPHLVGTITNIDTVGLQRSLDSIQSELRRRQVMFNEARNESDEGTIDIYKYQKLYHQGIVKKPIPHLLIICDEFAELKQQQEEFMDELISVARIGRSLGVHLILATQKPAGIVNDQIRGNSKFGICLKVQTTEDSLDVINKPDAADLKKAGQFYMNVGNNEYFTMGLSGWTGAPYFPSDTIKKRIDNSIGLISNIGNIIKKVTDEKPKVQIDCGEQLTNIVKYIYELAQQENIKTEQLWLDSIPETIYIEDIRKKYNVKDEEHVINPVIGEYDDPSNQRQGILRINFTKNGNTIVFGNAESGKETLIGTMIYDIINNYSPEDIQLYILDFGSEVLKIFNESPHVGDVILANNKEKVDRFFEIIQKEIKERINILSEFGGDYNLYRKSSGKSMPMINIIINNYENFYENYEEKYDEELLSLTRDGIKCGIFFIITANGTNNIRYRLAQNFRQKIALQLNNDDEYYNVFDDIRKKRPSPIFGRGLVKLDNIYEFQTAKICDSKYWSQNIKGRIKELNEKYKIKAKAIPVLPDRVNIEDIKEDIIDIETLPIGISKKSLKVFKYNFKKNLINIITAKNLASCEQYVRCFIDELKLVNNLNIYILDSEKIIETVKGNLETNYINMKLDIENNMYKNKENLCIIIGIDKFINNLENNENEFFELLAETQKLGNYTFVIIDRASKIKNREYDAWYKEYIYGDTGIWIGRGVNDQYLINMNSNGYSAINNYDDSFGYVIQQEEYEVIKLLGVKGKEEDNE